MGNDTPVFYLRDPLKFPDLNHVVKRDPRTNLRNPVYKWDFFSQLPEAFHQLTIDFSDRGLPKSYRHMHGFGSHTFSFINADNERFWVKFHFRCQQGIENLMDDEAEALVGKIVKALSAISTMPSNVRISLAGICRCRLCQRKRLKRHTIHST